MEDLEPLHNTVLEGYHALYVMKCILNQQTLNIRISSLSSNLTKIWWLQIQIGKGLNGIEKFILASGKL